MKTEAPTDGSNSGERPDTDGRTGRAWWSSRRQFLAGVAVGATAGFAGCSGGLSDAGKRSFDENPVAAGVSDRPRLGPPRSETPITVVSFDDPSCPSCASLHDGAFVGIRSEWVEAGRATVHSRAYYFVHEWARPAVNALVETYRRDPAAYWSLKAAYYDHQDELDEDSVVDRTAAFLDESGAAVDPGPVTAAARERSHESVIAADDEAGSTAGVNGVPTVFLFYDGAFVTTLGDDRFEAYESAIESHA